jgi:hypothetical protein
MTRIDIAPGIDDSDHRLAPVILSVETHLRCAGPVTERTHVLLSVPTVTSQIFRLPTGHDALPSLPMLGSVLHLGRGGAQVLRG